MSFTKINHYEKEYADTHHECALTVTEGVENQPYTRGIRRILKKFYNRD